MPVIANPRQTALVTSRAFAEVMGKEAHRDNVFTLDWHMPTSMDPMIYAISVGKMRFSYKLISQSKAFCVNFMPFTSKDAVLFCGRHTGAHTDKFEGSGLTKEECDSIDCPRLGESVAFMECEVIDEFETGDHVIFIGKVMNHQIKSSEKRVFHVDKDEFTTTE